MVSTKGNINITDDMIQAARTLFMAKALVETIRPIVEDYQKRILAEIKPLANERDAKNYQLGFKVITEPKHSYLMNNTDFKLYLKRCNEERIKAGLHVDNEEFCPLLVAESLQRDAEHALIDVMQPVTHITADMVLSNGLDQYNKLIDLTLRLLAPYVKNKV